MYCLLFELRTALLPAAQENSFKDMAQIYTTNNKLILFSIPIFPFHVSLSSWKRKRVYIALFSHPLFFLLNSIVWF
jgi:hypothetical protein